MTRHRAVASLCLGAVLSVTGGSLLAAPASAALPRPKTYANCTALNKVFPHGIGKTGARDKTGASSKPVTTFTRHDATYRLNTKSDRDKDGIACEKR